ncbi:MAG: hypothetical protein QM754_05975 [Tepidisphaeraceae bacterium]
MKTTVERPEIPARREFLRGVGGVFVASAIAPHFSRAAGRDDFPFPIAVNDRAAGFRQQLSAFAFARACGASAVEVDLGRLGAAPGMINRLLDPNARRDFIQAAETSGVAISSIALTAFEDQPFSSHPKAEEYAEDLLYALRTMNVATGVLPVDATDDYRTTLVVERLRRLAPMAGVQGATLAISAELPPAMLADLLDRVGSPAVAAAIVARTGDDALGAMKIVGVKRIAQIRYRHNPSMDDHADGLARLVVWLRESGWRGAFVIDRPAAVTGDTQADVSSAVQRLRGLFEPTYS